MDVYVAPESAMFALVLPEERHTLDSVQLLLQAQYEDGFF